jgi:hypothetical protein
MNVNPFLVAQVGLKWNTLVLWLHDMDELRRSKLFMMSNEAGSPNEPAEC